MRIAVLRALPLGDLLCAVPVLRSFRRAWPDAEITLVGRPDAREFVERFGMYLDGLVELPAYPGLDPDPDIAAVPDFLRDAQGRGYDLVVQLHDDGAVTNPLAALLGGSRTAGFAGDGAWRPDPEGSVTWPDRGPEPMRLLLLPDRLGLPVDGPALELPLSDDDRAGRPDGDYAVLAPGRGPR